MSTNNRLIRIISHFSYPSPLAPPLRLPHSQPGADMSNLYAQTRLDRTEKALAALRSATEAYTQKQMEQQRPASVAELEVYYAQLWPLLQTLIEAQKNPSAPSFMDVEVSADELETLYVTFAQWLKRVAPDSGLDDSFVFSSAVPEGSGVVAARDLEADELFMRIPRKAMLTFETALESPLRVVIERDERLQRSHSLATALHLLFERLAGASSFWAPYLAILPAAYTTPLHASPAELRALKGSATYAAALLMVTTHVRQYVDAVDQIAAARARQGVKLPEFTFREFRWAVATLMARQNKILASSFRPGGRPVTTIALIPGFDSLNHAPFGGALKSAFDWPTQSSESFLHAAVANGGQIYIDYGGRPNSLLFAYQGFVVPALPGDRLLARFSLAVGDPLFKIKAMVSARLGLTHAEFAVPIRTATGAAAGAVPPPFAPLDQWRDVWRVLAVQCMTREEVSAALLGLTKAFKEAGVDPSKPGMDGAEMLEILQRTKHWLFADDCPDDWRVRVMSALKANVEAAHPAAAAEAARAVAKAAQKSAERREGAQLEIVEDDGDGDDASKAAAAAAEAGPEGEAVPDTAFTRLARKMVDGETALVVAQLARIEAGKL